MSARFSQLNLVLAIWFKISSSATFCIVFAINLSHISTVTSHVVHFKNSLILPNQVGSITSRESGRNRAYRSSRLAGKAFHSIWLNDNKTKLFCFFVCFFFLFYTFRFPVLARIPFRVLKYIHLFLDVFVLVGLVLVGLVLVFLLV